MDVGYDIPLSTNLTGGGKNNSPPSNKGSFELTRRPFDGCLLKVKHLDRVSPNLQ